MIGLIVFLPMAGALISYIAGRRGGEEGRGAELVSAAVTCLVLVLALILPFTKHTFSIGTVLGSGLSFTADGFRCVYAIVTAVMWAGTGLFSLEYFSEEREHIARYMCFFLLTLGATEGVMLSADLMTTFVFFEILSFTSFTWVIHEQTSEQSAPDIRICS